MNPLIVDVASALVRAALIWIAAKLTASGMFDASLAARITDPTVATGIAVGAGALIWSIWQKYNSRKKLVTALSMPEGSTEKQVEQAIKSGVSLPAASTPKDVAPEAPTVAVADAPRPSNWPIPPVPPAAVLLLALLLPHPVSAHELACSFVVWRCDGDPAVADALLQGTSDDTIFPRWPVGSADVHTPSIFGQGRLGASIEWRQEHAPLTVDHLAEVDAIKAIDRCSTSRHGDRMMVPTAPSRSLRPEQFITGHDRSPAAIAPTKPPGVSALNARQVVMEAKHDELSKALPGEVVWLHALVVPLDHHQRPADVPRLVIAVYIDAVECVSGRRASAYICDKACHVEAPAAEDGDASATVVRIALVSRIETALLHPIPGDVLG